MFVFYLELVAKKLGVALLVLCAHFFGRLDLVGGGVPSVVQDEHVRLAEAFAHLVEELFLGLGERRFGVDHQHEHVRV